MPLFAVIGAAALLGFHAAEVRSQRRGIELYRLAEMPTLLAIPLFTFAAPAERERRRRSGLVALTRALLGWLPGGLGARRGSPPAPSSPPSPAPRRHHRSALGAPALPGAAARRVRRAASASSRHHFGAASGCCSRPRCPHPVRHPWRSSSESAGPSRSTSCFSRACAWRVMVLLTVGPSACGPTRPAAQRLLAAEAPRPCGRRAGSCRCRWWCSGASTAVSSPSRGAAVTVIYVFVVEVLVHREIPLREVPARQCARRCCSSAACSWILASRSPRQTTSSTPGPCAAVRGGAPLRRTARWPSCAAEHLPALLGMMLDIFAALVIVVPLLLPIAVGYGVDPVHLASSFLAKHAAGYFTPPVA